MPRTKLIKLFRELLEGNCAQLEDFQFSDKEEEIFIHLQRCFFTETTYTVGKSVSNPRQQFENSFLSIGLCEKLPLSTSLCISTTYGCTYSYTQQYYSIWPGGPNENILLRLSWVQHPKRSFEHTYSYVAYKYKEADIAAAETYKHYGIIGKLSFSQW